MINVPGTYESIWQYLDSQNGSVAILRAYFKEFLGGFSAERAHGILHKAEEVCQEHFVDINIDGGVRFSHIPHDIAVRYFAYWAKKNGMSVSENSMIAYVGSLSEYTKKKKLERSQKPSSPTQPTIPTNNFTNVSLIKEPSMSNAAPIKPVEIKTYFYGKESKDVSDNDIFDKISNLEASVAILEKIQSKPKKLVEQIDAIKAEIKECVSFCDTRVVE